MVAAVFGVNRMLAVEPLWLMIVEIVVGVVVYIGAIILLDGNPYRELREMLRDTRVGARV